METSEPAYVLGHSDRELARLKAQARMIEPGTRRIFLEAGVGADMRVLDIGSGAGDVAFLAAEIVGASGEVIGTDKSAAAIASATRSADERGLSNVSFREGDPAELVFDGPFDAVVGRYVLLFQADASVMVRKLATHVRPGGLMVFHEPDWASARAIPAAPIYDRCCAWIQEVFRLGGTDTNMAGRLFTIIVQAGLATPTMRMETFIAGGAAVVEFLQAVADITASLAPAMESHGVATNAEIGLVTLAERLKQEAAENGGVIVGRSEIGAWTRV
jgi:SAM-dependent methyltransferase